MPDYRLYIFLMDGGCKVSTRATSYDQAIRRIRQWTDDVEFVESLDDPLNGVESHKPSVSFMPAPVVKKKPSANISYADAINAALGE